MSAIGKIIIIGFPHCGTTILRCKIGEAENVHEIMYETDRISSEMMYTAARNKKEWVLIKIPYIPTDIVKHRGIQGSIYDKEGYHVIFTLRNPYYVFTSLTKRMGSNLEELHTVQYYEHVLQMYIE